MIEPSTDACRADSSGPAAATNIPDRPGRNATRTRIALLFGLLLAVQFAAAALTPLGTLGAWELDLFGCLSIAVMGASLALPPLLAVWATFGPERAAVRLPLTLWLVGAVIMGHLYGIARNDGATNGSVLLLASSTSLLAFAALQAPLWLVRAVRRWRLERVGQSARIPANVADAGGGQATKSTSQFSLTALLGWTLAVALLLGAFRGLFPELLDTLHREDAVALLVGTGFVGLLFALGGLPVVALAWIVLADGRRWALRIVLSCLVPLGLAIGCIVLAPGAASGKEFYRLILSLEAGAMLNGLLSFSVVRACGYQLRRRPKKPPATPPHGPPATVSRARFAFALAPLLIVAAGLAGSVPYRLEHWRRGELSAFWLAIGFRASFADDGTISELKPNQIPAAVQDEICRRIAGLGDLRILDLSQSSLDDRQLALLGPLPRLESLFLAGTPVTDAGLKQLARFSRLASLDLSNTPITDAGLTDLRALPELQILQLSLTDVSDEGLSALERLPALHSVDVQLTAVSAAGAEKFRRSRPRSRVDVGACDVLLGRVLGATRTVFAVGAPGPVSIPFAHPVTLKRLHARGRAVLNGVTGAVTDAGLATLAAAQTELEELDLRESAVTDAGLPALGTFKRLKRLDLRGAGVSEQGVARLARALPGCQILR